MTSRHSLATNQKLALMIGVDFYLNSLHLLSEHWGVA